MTAAGLAIIYGFPTLQSHLFAPRHHRGVDGLSMALGLDIRTVGDMGELPSSLPVFLLPDVPFTLETLWIVLPLLCHAGGGGLLESMMTASIVDELTDTLSNKNPRMRGPVAWPTLPRDSIGGMAGCAMIGQSVINVKSGGRGRLSTPVAGVLLLIPVVFLGPGCGRFRWRRWWRS